MPGRVIVWKAIQEDGSSYWPKEFPIEVLDRWYKDIGPIFFASQYQSSPMDLEGNFLKRDYLSWYSKNQSPSKLDFEDIAFYIDPAASQTKSADFFSLAVGGRFNDIAYLLQLIRTKAPLHSQLEIIKSVYEIWQPSQVVIEATATQLYLVQHVQENTPFNVVPQKPKSSKDVKFSTCAAHFNAGRARIPGYQDDIGMWLPTEEFEVFVSEWVTYPRGTHDDTLDAVAGVIDALVAGVTAEVSLPPDNFDEMRTFLNDNNDGELSPEEVDAVLKEYYSESGVGTIRRHGLMTKGIMSRGLYR